MRHRFDRWQVSLMGVITLMLAVVLVLSLGGAAYAWSPGPGQNVVVENGQSFSGKTTTGTERPMLTLINTNATRLNAPPAGAMFFTVANTEMMRIANNGNVGIGDSTPTEGKLVVRTTSGTGVYSNSNNNAAALFRSLNSHGIEVQYAGGHGIFVNWAEQWGGDFTGILGGVKASAASGDIFLGISDNGSDTRFRVSQTGEVYADGTFHGGGADFAEMLPASGEMGPGDVLVIGSDGRLALSNGPESTAVAGVYSTKPGFVGGAGDDEDLAGKVPLAVVGVVPVKASAGSGSINPGDLLCTSGIPGHAMKAVQPKVGTIIGKALEGLASGTGIIKVLVTLQ